jgi:hypothetical protein
MEIMQIQYAFILEDQRREIFDLQLDGRSLEIINKEGFNFPFWTALDFYQCPHCPLKKENHPHCPVAVILAGVIQRFENVASYIELDLEVTTSQRRVTQRTTAQRALGSFLGLLFVASGCPHTNYFRPMARFHLPLSSLEDTVYRVSSMYLMAQYFKYKEGKPIDFEMSGLNDIFKNMHKVNIAISDRIRQATQTDSSLNAVIHLDAFLSLMPFISDEQMIEIRYLFEAYLADSK